MSLNIGGGFASSPAFVAPDAPSLPIVPSNPGVSAQEGPGATSFVTSAVSLPLATYRTQINTDTTVVVENTPSLPIGVFQTGTAGNTIVRTTRPAIGALIGPTHILDATSPATIATIYVSPNGNDTTGTGAIGNPYLTIDRAMSGAVAGAPGDNNIIEVQAATPGGSVTYAEPASFQQNYNTLRGRTGDTVTIVGNAGTGSGGMPYAFDFNSKTGCVVDGINADGENATYSSRKIKAVLNADNSTDCTIKNGSAQQTFGGQGVALNGASALTWDNYDWTDHGVHISVSGNPADDDNGFYCANPSADNVVISNSTFNRVGDHSLVELRRSTGFRFRNNSVNCDWSPITADASHQTRALEILHTGSSSGDGSTDWLVEGNVFLNVGGENDSTTNANKFAGQRGIFRNNLIKGVYSGWAIEVINTTENKGFFAEDLHFYNNTGYNMGRGMFSFFGDNGSTEDLVASTTGRITFQNNVSQVARQNPGSEDNDARVWYLGTVGGSNPGLDGPVVVDGNIFDIGADVEIKEPVSGSSQKTLTEAELAVPANFFSNTQSNVTSQFPNVSGNTLDDFLITGGVNDSPHAVISSLDTGTGTTLRVDSRDAYKFVAGDLVYLNFTPLTVVSVDSADQLTVDQTVSRSTGDPIVWGTVYQGLFNVGPVVQDVVTPEQISIYAPVTGSVPANLTASVEYKLTTDVTYTTGHPLYRIKPGSSQTPAVGSVVDAFAWPIIGLEQGQTYDVRVTFTDGVTDDIRINQFDTRSLPAAAGAVTKTATPANITTQLASLVPGDVLELQDGTYTAGTGGIAIRNSGTEANPIYIRGESRGGVIIQQSNTGFTNPAIGIGDTSGIGDDLSHVIIENLTLEGSGVHGDRENYYLSFFSQDTGNVNVTIRDITSTGFNMGVGFFYSAQGALVYNCSFTGNNLWTEAFFDTNLTWNNDGINLPGDGNCGFNNTLKGFGDTCSYAQHSGQDTFTITNNVHYYRNNIINSCDDCCESDHAQRNCTFYDNRVTNGVNMSSFDPLYAGPFVYARNVVINPWRNRIHKWNATNSGHFVYNNTSVSTLNQYDVFPLLYSEDAPWYQPNNGNQEYFGYRNNLVIYNGDADEALSLRNGGYNNLDWTKNGWSYDGQIQFDISGGQGLFSSFADFNANSRSSTPIFGTSTRQVTNDFIVESQPFETAVSLGVDARTEVTTFYIPALSSGSVAKNAGDVIPNITDDYAGGAPDIGAVIEGRSAVAYGDPATGSGTAPAWFTSLSNLTWDTPLSNWIGDVPDPLGSGVNNGTGGQSAVINKWNGMGMDQTRKTAFMLRHGGHEDYYGNEVYAIDFRLDNPAWARVKNSSSNSGGSPPGGFPNSTHTYWEESGDDGRWFCPTTTAGSPSGSADFHHAWEYNADTSQWIDRGYPGDTLYGGGSPSDYNEVTQQLALFSEASSNASLRLFDCSGGAFTLVDTATQYLDPGSGTEIALSIDTTNNIAMVQQRSGNTLWSIDLGNLSAGWTSFSPSGSRNEAKSYLTWHPASNAFIGWNGVGNIVKLSVTVDGSNRYSSGSFSSVAVSGSNPAGGSVEYEGTYSKIRLIRDMGNGDAMLVLVPRYGDPDCYVVRISGAI